MMRLYFHTPYALLFMLMAALLLLCSHLLVGTVGVLGLAAIAVFTAGAFLLVPGLALALLVLCVLAQNALLALASSAYSPQLFQLAQGTTFVVTLLLGAGACAMLLRHRSVQQSVIIAAIGFLVVTVAYAAVGAMQVSVPSMLSYARLYMGGPLLLLAGLWLCRVVSPNMVRGLLSLAAGLLVLWGVWEWFAPQSLYTLFNIDNFLSLKYAMRPDGYSFDSVQDVIAQGTRSYLNLSGDWGLELQALRLRGPSVHAIAYAYALAFFMLVMLMLRRPVLATACGIMLLVVGAKGALLLGFLTLALCAFYRLSKNNARWLLIATAVVVLLYVGGGLYYGIITQDYHVLGFMAGVASIVQEPLGHGIGVGGNLSDQAYAGRDFASYQEHGADYALESALGVMIFQLGIASAAFIWFYQRVVRALWRHAVANAADAPRLMLMPLALLVLLANCVFQEETLSPAGWGLWMLWAGFVLGWSQHHAADESTS